MEYSYALVPIIIAAYFFIRGEDGYAICMMFLAVAIFAWAESRDI